MKKKKGTILIFLFVLTLLSLKFLAGLNDSQSNLTIYPGFGNRMIFVKGGTYLMGDFKGDGAEDERPVHEVIINDFYISKYEVSVKEYKVFCEDSNTILPPEPEWGWKENHPMVNVSWNDASAFCQWLSKKTGKIYRLPFEAEWEFCARNAGQNIIYPVGDICTHELANYGKYSKWIKNKTIPPTLPVGSYTPNSLGLYNLTANVHEWVYDRYAPNYPSKSIKNNLKGYQTGDKRVGRGGSWRSPKEIGRCTNRNYGSPDFRIHNSGFRIALSYSKTFSSNL